jgi:bacterial/archaeal transporter family-2 protein
MFFILISIAAGAIVVISRILNTRLSEKTGLVESSFFNYFTGLLSALILFAIINDNTSLSEFHNIPFWAYLGGMLGVFVVILSSVVTPKMSTFYITLIIFIGQLFTGIIIDCILLKTIPFAKIIGGLLVVAGLTYNLKLDSTVKDTK